MPLFISRREKRLWLWTLAVLLAIYSTLGIAQPVSTFLRDNGLLSISFIAGMILVCVSVITIRRNIRPDKAELGVVLGVIAVYLMVFVRMEIPEERTHIIEYSVVAAFLYRALMERMKHDGKTYTPAVLSIVGTAVAGAIDEFIQGIIPSRVFDLRDILFNALAGLMAVGSIMALAWIRNRKNKRNTEEHSKKDRN